MTTTRRSVLAAAGAMASAGVLGACGAAQGGQPAQQAAPATIEFSFWGDQRLLETFQKDIADFNKDTPQVKVNTNHMPTDYYVKLEALIVAGPPPDLSAMANSSVPEFAAKGALRDLDVGEPARCVEAPDQGGGRQPGVRLPPPAALRPDPDVDLAERRRLHQ